MPARVKTSSSRRKLWQSGSGSTKLTHLVGNVLMAIPEEETCQFDDEMSSSTSSTSSSSGSDSESSDEATTSTIQQNKKNHTDKNGDNQTATSSSSTLHEGLARVNRERQVRGLPVLRRSRYLDALARHHARYMAQQGRVMHSVQTVEQLQSILARPHVGENIQRGASCEEMHRIVMDGLELPANRHNILALQFQEFGMGTMRGLDGQVYMCQYFRSA